MDFNRSLASFRPQLDATLNLLKLALNSSCGGSVRIMFSSSIAVVGRSPVAAGHRYVKEVPLENAAAIDRFGYAEAKWICERMLQAACQVYGDKIVATSVRIGQLTGGEINGAWNVAEHLPIIIKSCLAMGKFPELEGVSRPY